MVAKSDIFVRYAPRTPAPLVFDSPHSGHKYPADFAFSCPELALRQTEDSFIDDLFRDVTRHGGVLIAAQFPRAYIDVNRAIDDIDPQLLASAWPTRTQPSEKSRVGMGLVRRICKPGLPVYNCKLTVREVQARIDDYYQPYHVELARTIDDVWRKFGAAWHLNCHSMPSSGSGTSLHGSHCERADFVLGDRDGTTCAPAFSRFVGGILERMGYSVRYNDPYKGVEIVRRYGQPTQGVHSLQIEINRRLYLNEDSVTPNAGYQGLKTNLGALAAALRSYGEDQLIAVAAD